MARVEDGLSDTQAFALIFETTSTRNLLGLGLWSLRNAAFRETTLDPVMTMLSIGTEKLMKMTLGLLHVAEHGAWPPHSQYKNVWRHDLSLMSSEMLPVLRSRLHLATHRAVVEPLLVAVEEDPAWDPMMAALTRFGVSGRFYYLDQLAEQPQTGDKPEVLWDQAERTLLENEPSLRAQYDVALNGPPNEFDQFLHVLEARMADSFEGVWKLVSTAGMHDMLGQRGHSWGADFRPDSVGRQIRSAT
jgi:hypothetical protein